MRADDFIKNIKSDSLWRNVLTEKVSFYKQIWTCLKLTQMHLKAHISVQQEFSLFQSFFATLMTNWAKILTGLLFNAYFRTKPGLLTITKGIDKVLVQHVLIYMTVMKVIHVHVLPSKNDLDPAPPSTIWMMNEIVDACNVYYWVL